MHLVFSPVGNYLVVALLAVGLLVLLRFGPSHDRLSRRRRQVLLALRVLVVLLVTLAGPAVCTIMDTLTIVKHELHQKGAKR